MRPRMGIQPLKMSSSSLLSETLCLPLLLVVLLKIRYESPEQANHRVSLSDSSRMMQTHKRSCKNHARGALSLKAGQLHHLHLKTGTFISRKR